VRLRSLRLDEVRHKNKMLRRGAQDAFSWTSTYSALFRRGGRRVSALARDQLELKPHRFGKQKRPLDSPRRQFRAVSSASVYFQWTREHMVNRWCASTSQLAGRFCRREPHVKSPSCKTWRV